MPKPGPGERVFLLNIPFEERSLGTSKGATWFPQYGWGYVGKSLPAALERYHDLPARSWLRWLQDDLDCRYRPDHPAPAPDRSTGEFTLREEQEEDAELILTAKAAGAPEFLVGNDVGTGKTVVSIAAVKQMKNVRNVLVVCPLAVAPAWRLTLERMGDGGKRWCVINYESVKRLLEPPASAQAAKRTRTKNLRTARQGTPKVAWDVVIRDESHSCANPESQRTISLDRIIEGPSGAKPAFVVDMSATAASNPAQLSYAHRGLFWRSGARVQSSISMEEYVEWCQDRSIGVTKSRFGDALAWEKDQSDLTRMHHLVFSGQPSWAVRRKRPDWPEQQRIPVPVELSNEELDAYMVEWAEFQKAMRALDKAKRTPTSPDRRPTASVTHLRAKGLAATTRFRQKAGLLRAPYTADFVAQMVRKGRQVAVSCEYIATVDAIVEALRKAKVPCVTFTGKNPETREAERIAFQRGEVPVIVFTPAEGFNLHAGERSVDGNSVPRVTVVAEPRWSPKKALQIEGRTHRDGTDAPCYYAYAVKTVEMKVISVVIEGMRNTGKIMGDDTAPFEHLATALGVPFLDAA